MPTFNQLVRKGRQTTAKIGFSFLAFYLCNNLIKVIFLRQNGYFQPAPQHCDDIRSPGRDLFLV